MKLEFSSPLYNKVSVNQYFGQADPIYKAQGILGHNGMDLLASHGTPVKAMHDGLASFQIDNGGGHGVVLVTDKEYDYLGGTAYYKSIYWHLCDGLKEPRYQSPIADKTGFVKVKRGDLIGYADSTGQSTGDHLHIGVKPVAKGEAWGTWDNLAQKNGYNGAIDPAPFFLPGILPGSSAPSSPAPKPVDLVGTINDPAIQGVIKKAPNQKWIDSFLSFYRKAIGK